jgi:hypothetical protein
LGVFGLWCEFAAVVVEQGKTGAMGTFGIESLVVVGGLWNFDNFQGGRIVKMAVA